MTKRHKITKTRQNVTNPKKKVRQVAKKSRSGNAGNSRTPAAKRMAAKKLAAKNPKLVKRGTPAPMGRNSGTKRKPEKTRAVEVVTRRRKETGKNETPSRQKNAKAIRLAAERRKEARKRKAERRKKTQRVKRARNTVKKLDLSEQSTKLKTSSEIQLDKEGKRRKEKNISGYRKYYNIDLGKGKFKDKLDSIRTGNFSFLKDALTRNRPIKGAGPKAPQAVAINILIKKGKQERWINLGISDVTFVVNEENIKKLTLERLVEYQDNFLERADENDDYLEGSGKVFQPSNIVSISYRFIY